MADEPKPAPAPGGDSTISGVTLFRQRALALGFGAISLFLFVLLVMILRPVMRPVLWAIALAILFYPVHSRVLRLLRGRAGIAAGVTTLLTMATFAVPAVLFVLNFISEAQHLWPELRGHLRPDTFQQIAAWIDRSSLRPYIPWLFQGEPYLGAETIEGRLRDAVSSFSSMALSQIGEFGKNVPDSAIGAALTILTLFFFLRYGPRWVEQVKGGLPLEPQHAENLIRIIAGTVNAVFRGVIVTAAVQALLAGLAFVVTQAPAPVVLAGITFLAALIPFVGPVAVWLPVFNHAITLTTVGTYRRVLEGNDMPGWAGPLPWEQALRVGHYNLDERGELKSEVREIVRICADRNVALLFGHATHAEIYKLAEEVQKVGLKRAVIDHPFSPFLNVSPNMMKELRGAGGIFPIGGMELERFPVGDHRSESDP